MVISGSSRVAAEVPSASSGCSVAELWSRAFSFDAELRGAFLAGRVLITEEERRNAIVPWPLLNPNERRALLMPTTILRGLDASSGRQAWARSIKGRLRTLEGGERVLVYASSAGTAGGLELSTGVALWERRLETLGCPPAAALHDSAGVFVVRTGTGLVGLDPVNGATRWEVVEPPQGGDLMLLADASTSNVICASSDGRVRALDGASGLERWRRTLLASSGPCLLSGDGPLIGGEGMIVRFDPGSGAIVWKSSLPAGAVASVGMLDGRVWCAVEAVDEPGGAHEPSSTLITFEMANGSKLWSRSICGEVFGAKGNRAAFTLAGSTLHGIDARSGSSTWRLQVLSPVGVCVPVDPNVVLCDEAQNSALRCFKIGTAVASNASMPVATAADVVWRVGLGDVGAVRDEPLLVDGQLVYVTADQFSGRLCLSPDDGRIRWAHPRYLSQLGFRNDDCARRYLLDAFEGTILSREGLLFSIIRLTDGTVRHPPIGLSRRAVDVVPLDGDSLGLTSLDGGFEVVGAATFDERWSLPPGTLDRVARIQPLVSHGMVYLVEGAAEGGEPGGSSVVCIDLAGRKTAWRRAVAGGVACRPSIVAAVDAGPALVLGTRDGEIVVLDAISGRPIGQFEIDARGRAVSRIFAAAEQTVVCVVGSDALVAVDARSGAPLWRHDCDGDAVAGLSLQREMCLVTTANLDFRLLNLGTGEVVWRATVECAAPATAALVGETIILATWSGDLVALRPRVAN